MRLRDGLARVVQFLNGAEMAGETAQLQRTFRQCAAQLEAAVLTLSGDLYRNPYMRPDVAKVAEGLEDSLGMKHRSAARLLALLLVQPGFSHPSDSLAVSLGVAHGSVRVFAFHVRNWLDREGMTGILESHWGSGYSISASNADRLLRRSFHLRSLVEALHKARGETAGQDRELADGSAPGDPFPVVRQRAPGAQVGDVGIAA